METHETGIDYPWKRMYSQDLGNNSSNKKRQFMAEVEKYLKKQKSNDANQYCTYFCAGYPHEGFSMPGKKNNDIKECRIDVIHWIWVRPPTGLMDMTFIIAEISVI